MLSKLRLAPQTPAALDAIFRAADTNGDNTIDFDEFVHILRHKKIDQTGTSPLPSRSAPSTEGRSVPGTARSPPPSPVPPRRTWRAAAAAATMVARAAPDAMNDTATGDAGRVPLSDEAVQEMRLAFAAFDQDGSGTIETSELARAMARMGMGEADYGG